MSDTRGGAWSRAADRLAASDPVVATVIDLAGPPVLRPPDPDGAFGALCRAIIYQQLAGAAARTIHERFRRAVGGRVTPAAVAATADATVRAAGVSAGKLAALRDLTTRVLEGRLDLDGLADQDDDEVVRQLTGVRGIGPWTAQMHLLFELGRLDVWPVGDLGVRTGWALGWGPGPGSGRPPAPREVEAVADPHRPHRSITAWCCWRIVDLHRSGRWPARRVPGGP